MLVLHKTPASQTAAQHTPPAAVITTGDSTGKKPLTKNKLIPVQTSVVGDTSTTLSTPDDGVQWFRSKFQLALTITDTTNIFSASAYNHLTPVPSLPLLFLRAHHQ